MSNLPKIALGAWAWGNDGTFGNDFTAEGLKPIFDAAMANGLNLWDTAYAYGMGTSEKVLAGFIKDLPRESYLISDKFTPQCANGKPTAMADMIEMQLKLMNLSRFDIYWIHNVWDAHPFREQTGQRHPEGSRTEAVRRAESLQPHQPFLRGIRHTGLLQGKRHHLLRLHGAGAGRAVRQV